MAPNYAFKISAILDADHKAVREIENHEQLMLAASSLGDIAEYQAQSLAIQHEAAVAVTSGLASIYEEVSTTNALVDLTNYLLADASAEIRSLNQEASKHSILLGQINESASRTVSELSKQSGILTAGFNTLVALLHDQQRALVLINEALRQPLEMAVQEQLRNAEQAFQNGVRLSGKLQKDEFTDALRLFNLILEDPIGSRNEVVWFRTGWLYWNLNGNLDSAERAFCNAARISSGSGNQAVQTTYFAQCMRQYAHILYIKKRYRDAFAAIQEANQASPSDYHILFDYARYAAKARSIKKAIDALDKCIDIIPATVITMFAEPDFHDGNQAMVTALIQLLERQTLAARRTASDSVETLSKLVEEIEAAKAQRIASIPLSPEVNFTLERVHNIRSSSFFDALRLKSLSDDALKVQIKQANRHLLTINSSKKRQVKDLNKEIHDTWKRPKREWASLDAKRRACKEKQKSDRAQRHTVESPEKERELQSFVRYLIYALSFVLGVTLSIVVVSLVVDMLPWFLQLPAWLIGVGVGAVYLPIILSVLITSLVQSILDENLSASRPLAMDRKKQNATREINQAALDIDDQITKLNRNAKHTLSFLRLDRDDIKSSIQVIDQLRAKLSSFE